MAATADKYSNNTLNDKDTVSGQTTTKNIFALMPLALTEYRNPATSSQPASQTQAEDDASFKQTFYCHEVWHKKDTDNKECVIGLLRATPSLSDHPRYADLHGVTGDPHPRVGKLRLVKNGIDYIVLNDGGLNTKPWGMVENIYLCAQNLIIFSVAYANAYYAHTTSHVISLQRQVYRNNEWVTTQTVDKSLTDLTKTAKTSGNSVYYTLYDEMLALSPNVDDRINLVLSCYNEETRAYGSTSPAANPYVSEGVYATVTEKLDLVELYKINSVNDDPLQGTRWLGIVKHEYYANLDREDPDYPTLYNLFAANPDTAVYTQVRIQGVAGSAPTPNILSSYLDDGLYYGFPNIWAPGQEVDPGLTVEYKIVQIQGENSGATGFIGKGQPFKYFNRVSPTPSHTATLDTTTPFSMQISTSISGYVSWATQDGANAYTVYIYPHIVVKGKNGTCSVEVKIIGRMKNSDPSTWSVVHRMDYPLDDTQEISLSFPNSNAWNTTPIPVTAYDAAETPAGYIQAVVHNLTLQSAMDISSYEYVIQVVASEPTTDEEGEETNYPYESSGVTLEELLVTNS